MCCLCPSISQEEGIDIVCHHYEEHYQSKLPILTSYLGDLMRVILTENWFKFADKHYLQTHGITMATKIAVAFSVIFMAHVEKQLLHASPYSHFSGWKKFIDDTFSVWTLSESEINNFIDFANSSHSTIKFTLVKTDCFPWQWSQTHFKLTETFQETNFSSFYLLRKGFCIWRSLVLP